MKYKEDVFKPLSDNERSADIPVRSNVAPQERGNKPAPRLYSRVGADRNVRARQLPPKFRLLFPARSVCFKNSANWFFPNSGQSMSAMTVGLFAHGITSAWPCGDALYLSFKNIEFGRVG